MSRKGQSQEARGLETLPTRGQRRTGGIQLSGDEIITDPREDPERGSGEWAGRQPSAVPARRPASPPGDSPPPAVSPALAPQLQRSPPREALALMTSPVGGTRMPVPQSWVSQPVSVPPDSSSDDYVEILP